MSQLVSFSSFVVSGLLCISASPHNTVPTDSINSCIFEMQVDCGSLLFSGLGCKSVSNSVVLLIMLCSC